jgi:hypothetical protein
MRTRPHAPGSDPKRILKAVPGVPLRPVDTTDAKRAPARLTALRSSTPPRAEPRTTPGSERRSLPTKLVSVRSRLKTLRSAPYAGGLTHSPQDLTKSRAKWIKSRADCCQSEVFHAQSNATCCKSRRTGCSRLRNKRTSLRTAPRTLRTARSRWRNRRRRLRSAPSLFGLRLRPLRNGLGQLPTKLPRLRSGVDYVADGRAHRPG